MNGFSDKFHEQLKAFKLIHQCALSKIPESAWTIGGGTMLALVYFQHRMSYDVDIFVQDPQYFSYLSPKWFIDNQADFAPEYLDQANHIQLTTSGVKVDILLAPNRTGDKPVIQNVAGVSARVDSIGEITAKKIHYRGVHCRGRDIFDIAVSVSRYPAILAELNRQGAVTLDELFALRCALSKMDAARYREESKIVQPESTWRDICDHAPEIVLKSIDDLVRIDLHPTP